MLCRKNQRNPRNGSRGAVMAEAAICLPLLVLMFAGMVDMLFLSSTYMSMSQIAREAVLSGSALSDIAELNSTTTSVSSSGSASNNGTVPAELAACYSDPDLQNYRPLEPTSTPNESLRERGLAGTCAARVINWRVQKLAETNKLRIKPESLTVSVAPLAVDTHTRIAITISASYDGIFWLLNGTHVETQAKASADRTPGT